MNIKEQLAKELSLQPFQVDNTLALFDEGATVPFVARYRKENTGSLDETVLRELEHQYNYYKELEDRRATIISSIVEQGKMTDELRAKLEKTISKVELEDLYLPYKPKRVTRGKKATDAGLFELALRLRECNEPAADLEAEAVAFVNDKSKELGFDTPAKALAGACDIIAEEISDDAEVRRYLRELAFAKGALQSTVRKEFAEEKTKFQMYYDHKEPVKNVAGHRALAMFRGEREEVLRLELVVPRDEAIDFLRSRFVRHPKSASAHYLELAVSDSFDRLLSTATETEVRKDIREKAEIEAFSVFGSNLRALLMAAPAGHKAVLGIDPGFRTGCKVVALDDTGKLMEFVAIYPTIGREKDAEKVLLALFEKYGTKLVAIGNGTASRETDEFVRRVVETMPEDRRPLVVVVSEAGASVYSASEVAVREFPDQDVTVRGAVSIGRRLQDPLSELVKIDPKAIGVGQYQHDVNQASLRKSLEEVVESCVNRVGVDLNMASAELLRYVAGLNTRTAEAIVKHRNDKGKFSSRKSLLDVTGLGAKTFEQAAGFLRVPDSENPLDNSSVHPERYAFVNGLAKNMNVSVKDLVGNAEKLSAIDKMNLVSAEIGLPTIEDILSELEKPGRDPRDEFKYAKFSDSVKEIKDLKIGMKLEGTVTNVTNFGAFVDIGVHQDGLVHISQLADKFVSDPHQVVTPGQIVSVTVLEVDEQLKRIALTMKKGASEKPAPVAARKPEEKRPQRAPEKSAPTPKPKSVSDLAAAWGSAKSNR